MAVIKEKKIKVESTIEDTDSHGNVESSEKCEITPEAFLNSDGEKITLSYSESSEGGDIYTDIIITASDVRVVRRGAIESNFRFADGLSESSLYKMPPYSFDAEITTRKIRNNISERGGVLTILYDMKIGGAYKKVRMKITAPED